MTVASDAPRPGAFSPCADGARDSSCREWEPCSGHVIAQGSDTELESDRVFQREEVTILSPLRYPGSKRRLASYIHRALVLNHLKPDLFIEPFAGGASVALQLASVGAVDKIGLVEIDPLVAAFWQTAFDETDWLIERVRNVEVTLRQWQAFKHGQQNTRRGRAIACLFLNRTSFSGILAPSAGPIGGLSQTSEYQIDCRFSRDTLVKRLRQLERLKGKVAFVLEESWDKGIEEVRKRQVSGDLPANAFYYIDPPFFEKAERLYTHYFRQGDHEKLRDFVLALDQPWLVSYDSADGVRDLYRDANAGLTHVESIYSTASTGGNRKVKEIIITNLKTLPKETRIWRSTSEWRSPNGRSGTMAAKQTLATARSALINPVGNDECGGRERAEYF